MVQDLKEYYNSKGKIYISFEYKDKKDFYDVLNALEKFSEDNIKVYGTSREGAMEVVVESTLDIDESTKQISNHAKEDEEETQKAKEKPGRKKKDVPTRGRRSTT